MVVFQLREQSGQGAGSGAWSTLEAVESGRMYFMEKKLFNLKPNGLWAEAYQILYETLTKNEA